MNETCKCLYLAFCDVFHRGWINYCLEVVFGLLLNRYKWVGHDSWSHQYFVVAVRLATRNLDWLSQKKSLKNEERGRAHWHWPVHFDDHVSSHSRLPGANMLVALNEALWCQMQHKSS